MGRRPGREMKCPWCGKPYVRPMLRQKHMLTCAKRPFPVARGSQ